MSLSFTVVPVYFPSQFTNDKVTSLMNVSKSGRERWAHDVKPGIGLPIMKKKLKKSYVHKMKCFSLEKGFLYESIAIELEFRQGLSIRSATYMHSVNFKSFIK